jgi:hypothetical protein
MKDKVSEHFKMLHTGELLSLYRTPIIIRGVKSRRLRWAEHVPRIRETGSAHRNLVVATSLTAVTRNAEEEIGG